MFRLIIDIGAVPFFSAKAELYIYRVCEVYMFHDAYKSVIDSSYNHLCNIQDITLRNLVMQKLAGMWCIIFSMWMGSTLVFGVSSIVHTLLIAGVFVTITTFETARRKPEYFDGLGRSGGGEYE